MQYKDEILAAIPTLIKPVQILYFIDFIVLGILLIGKWVQIKSKNYFKWVPVVVTSCCILMFCTFYHFIPESLELVTGYIYSKYNSVRYGTIYGYHFVDLKNAVTNHKTAPYNTYEEMIENYKDLKNEQNVYAKEHSPDSEQYTGIAQGKNVFVVQLESIL